MDGGIVGGNTSTQSMAPSSLGSGSGKPSNPLITFIVKESMHKQLFGAASTHCRGQNLKVPSPEMQHTLGSVSRCSSQSVPNRRGIESANNIINHETRLCTNRSPMHAKQLVIIHYLTR